MIEITALLERAERLGVELRSDGELLRYRGNRSAVEELLPALSTHRPEIIALLHERAALARHDFTDHGYLCRRCKGIGRVAVFGGEITCKACVVVARNHGSESRPLALKESRPH